MMKLLNKKQKCNGGFSLVELIVVIAIMVVLVAVLAPVFTRYIESSRRSTDVSTASNIAEAVLADAAEGKITTSVTDVAVVANNPSAIQSTPQVSGTKWTGAEGAKLGFTYSYNKDTNIATVSVAGHSDVDLASEAGAEAYKDRSTDPTS